MAQKDPTKHLKQTPRQVVFFAKKNWGKWVKMSLFRFQKRVLWRAISCLRQDFLRRADFSVGRQAGFGLGPGVGGWGEGESYLFSLSLERFESVQKLICRWNWNSLKRLLICRILLSSCLKCTLAVFFLSSLGGPLLHPLFPLLNKIILALLSLLRRKGG